MLKCPVYTNNKALKHVEKQNILLEKCKLLTGYFPIFPYEKRFINLP
jgi:hypothetical protein